MALLEPPALPLISVTVRNKVCYPRYPPQALRNVWVIPNQPPQLIGIPEFPGSGRKSWTLDPGFWMLDLGPWKLDCGL